MLVVVLLLGVFSLVRGEGSEWRSFIAFWSLARSEDVVADDVVVMVG